MNGGEDGQIRRKTKIPKYKKQKKIHKTKRTEPNTAQVHIERDAGLMKNA